MNSDLNLKNTRVPTFIPLEMEPSSENSKPAIAGPPAKKVTKRKRTAAPENIKPSKRKISKKRLFNEELIFTPSEENQVWIGATTDKETGAFSIYYGENDERNCSDTFTRENELQDIEYAYVLGTLKAIESHKPKTTENEKDTKPLIVNTTCRDLPRAIASQTVFFHHQNAVNTIRDLINEKKQDQEIQVRHVSGRGASNEHKAAISLASLALEKLNQPTAVILEEKAKVVEEVVEKKVVEEDIVVEAAKPMEVVEEEKLEEEQVTTVVEENILVVAAKPMEIVKEEKLEEEQVTTIVEQETVLVNEAAAAETPAEIIEETVEEVAEEKVVAEAPLVVSKKTQEVDNLNIGNKEGEYAISTTATITTEQIITTVETKVEITTIKAEDDQVDSMEVDKEEPSAPATAPLSWFGNLLDVLYAPFRGRNANN